MALMFLTGCHKREWLLQTSIWERMRALVILEKGACFVLGEFFLLYPVDNLDSLPKFRR